MRCLVTGCEGYIGSRLYAKLCELGHDVRGMDIKNEEEDILCDLDLYEDFAPEYIFHLAALPRVEYSVLNPVETFEVNALGTTKLLHFAKKIKAKRFIFSSSSIVYGGEDGLNCPYAVHKITSEMECELYSKIYGLDTISLRYFNVYSEDQPIEGPYSTIVAVWMDKLRNGEKLLIEGDGEQKRDFVHVDDIVDANIFAMNHKKPFGGSRVDVGTGTSYSINYIKNYIEKIHSDAEFVSAVGRKNDVKETLANVKALETIGWSSNINFDEGLKKCFGG
jgi:UDP-glucose 4-epimerase|tara:strand:- start:8795 stop:9628 length:834 start_codon:yes stop_codon:yes gene_type:complete